MVVEALIGAMQHAAMLQVDSNPSDTDSAEVHSEVVNSTATLKESMSTNSLLIQASSIYICLHRKEYARLSKQLLVHL